MALKTFNFNVIKKDKFARLGKIQTSRGTIDTPVFMPVGTQATVKGSFISDVIKTGSQIVLSNTYHLMIRPGADRIKKAGGLHNFMNCKIPILTDSGGDQIMSLSKLNKIDKLKGAIFNSHVDGKKFNDVVRVPRYAVRDDKIWVVNQEGILTSKKVTVLRYEQGQALIISGLDNGDEILLTKLSAPVDGMRLNVY